MSKREKAENRRWHSERLRNSLQFWEIFSQLREDQEQSSLKKEPEGLSPRSNSTGIFEEPNLRSDSTGTSIEAEEQTFEDDEEKEITFEEKEPGILDKIM